MKDCSRGGTIPETGFPDSQDSRKTEKNIDDSLKNSDFLSLHNKEENLNYSSVLYLLVKIRTFFRENPDADF